MEIFFKGTSVLCNITIGLINDKDHQDDHQ